jgi:hypothetical protein
MFQSKIIFQRSAKLGLGLDGHDQVVSYLTVATKSLIRYTRMLLVSSTLSLLIYILILSYLACSDFGQNT